MKVRVRSVTKGDNCAMDLKKIVLIGPVYPYKGGIAHYTGLMYRALSKKYDTAMVSYKMQYPKILFRKEQRDYSNDTFKVDGTKFWLHTANPLNWLQTANKINRLQPDMVIIQWWHPYFAPCYQSLCRHLQSKIVFVCHNVFPHERFPMDRALTKGTLKRGDAFIVHSQKDETDLKSILQTPVCCRTVLPSYNAFRFHDLDKAEAREKLHLSQSDKLILFFGFVREYKGLRYLIQAMPEVVNAYPEAKLLIVGDFGSDKDDYTQLIQHTGVAENILVYAGYTPDQEVENYFFASDLVALPYISATQSAVVQMAFGFDKPVIATSVGGLPDVIDEGKTGYLVEPGNPKQLAQAVIRYFKEERETEFSENVRREAWRFSWDRMVENIEKSALKM